jgi:chemotaxis methyl-accepting protein methylase
LSARLKPDGALFICVSESLLRLGTPLLCEEKKGVFLYRKAT